MDTATIHTSTRIATTPPPVETIEWWARSEDGDRHAYPRREGFPPPAICGVRWDVRAGHQGARYCPACIDGLKAQLRSATTALGIVEAETLAAGDHFARAEAAG